MSDSETKMKNSAIAKEGLAEKIKLYEMISYKRKLNKGELAQLVVWKAEYIRVRDYIQGRKCQYDTSPCTKDGCKNSTAHKSGLCRECRTKPCVKCKTPTMFNKLGETMCTACKKTKKSKQNKVYME